jgi:trehalose/maltose hydrolase-like predicted phosphorylase
MLNSQNNAIYPFCDWEIVEEVYKPEHRGRNETVFALGNGCFGTRGTFEEGGSCLEGSYINGFFESKAIHYPETAYGYAEKSQTMLNVTNGKLIRLFVEDEEFSMGRGTLLEYQRKLDLREGILARSLVWRSPQGRQVKIRIERLVSFSHANVLAIRYQVTTLNFCGRIRLWSVLDGDVANLAAQDDPRIGSGLEGRALRIVTKTTDGLASCITQKTENSGLALACALINRLEAANVNDQRTIDLEFQVGNEFDLQADQGCRVTLDKYVAYFTSSSMEASSLPAQAAAIAAAAATAGFERLKSEQADYLRDFWSAADVEIKGDSAVQQGIRLNMFHLLQAAGRDGLSSVCAKGLTGEGYEGHYFWDTEIFILPFFLYNSPPISRKLLEYRFSILDKARARARKMSHAQGALFPWRTIDGDECSAYYPAGTAQYHINADIAFAVNKYVEATQDTDFKLSCGAEILFETARLWTSLGFYNPRKGNRFCINGVTGPDEYNVLVDNNCYTNLMARENLNNAYDTATWIKTFAPETFSRLASRIGLDEREVASWREAAENMLIPYDNEAQIHLQDDRFLDRVPWDLAALPDETRPLLLHYHPLVIYRHQVCKQADLVLALFLLGNCFTLAEKKRNYDYYEKVTTHDSSLSTAVFSIVASEIGYHEQAYNYFQCTARMDLDNCHGNTEDGIHAANMAGTWMCVVNGFAGMRDYCGKLSFAPYLPGRWEQYRFKVTYQGRLLRVTVKSSETRYLLIKGDDLTISHRGMTLVLRTGVETIA